MNQDLIEKTIEKLKRSRTHLLLSSGYDSAIIGSLSIKYPFVPANEYKGIKIDTAATNGAVIVFNPNYIDTLSHSQTIFLIAHETMHCMLCHHLRRAGRKLETWNHAGDYVINEILIADKIGEPISGALFEPKYHGQNTESVFKQLYQEEQQKEESQDPAGDDEKNSDDGAQNDFASGSGAVQTISDPAGGVIDAPAGDNPADIESELKENLITAEKFAEKSAGPGSGKGSILKRLLDTITAPKANWKDILKQWFDSNDKTDFSFIRPRHGSSGYLLPGLYSESLGKVLIAIDVSGSVLGCQGAIESFQSEINSLRESMQFDSEVIYFHSRVERVETFGRHETITIEVKETGGTRLKSVFDYISDNGLANQITGLIVFTDLEIDDFPRHEPSFKTLFVKYGNRPYCERAPIGETINIIE